MYRGYIGWILVAMATGTLADTNCTIPPKGDNPPDLPTWPEQYTMRVQMSIGKVEPRIIEVEEVYDSPGDQGAVTVTEAGQVMKSILNFTTGERYDIFPNDTCVTAPIADGLDQMQMETFVKLLRSPSDLTNNLTFVGNDTIRTVPVSKWAACHKFNELNETFRILMDYSRDPYMTSEGDKNVPIRLEIEGKVGTPSGPKDINQVYDFLLFKKGSPKDKTVFQTPRGVVCPERKLAKPLPRLPDQFTNNIEVSMPEGHLPFNEKMYYDFDYKLIRIDMSSRIHKNQKNKIPLTRIEDYNMGVEYVIDKIEGNCSVHKMVNNILPGGDHHNLTMQHGWEILSFKNRTYIYQGERTLRGMTVDAWANASHNGNFIQEVYFLQPAPVKGATIPNAVIMGVYTRNKTAERLEKGGAYAPGSNLSLRHPPERLMHIYDHVDGHPDISVFDVSLCYRKDAASLYLTFSVSGTYSQDVYGHQAVFYPAVRTAIAKKGDVHVVRVSNLEVRQDEANKNKMVISFLLLDVTPVPVNGSATKQTSLHEAKAKLMQAAQHGMIFTVKYPTVQKIFVVHASSMKPAPSVADSNEKSVTYTPAAMAGLGIGMIIFGCIIGLLIAFVIHRRVQTEVPYERNSAI